MADLEETLPNELIKSTLWPGNELVLPYPEALRAVGIAPERQIAVLGFEALEVRMDGLLTEHLSDPSPERIHVPLHVSGHCATSHTASHFVSGVWGSGADGRFIDHVSRHPRLLD
jgi:hypothetical protein